MEEQYDDSGDGEFARKLGGAGWFVVALVLALGALGVILGGQAFEKTLHDPGSQPDMRLEPKAPSAHH